MPPYLFSVFEKAAGHWLSYSGPGWGGKRSREWQCFALAKHDSKGETKETREHQPATTKIVSSLVCCTVFFFWFGFSALEEWAGAGDPCTWEPPLHGDLSKGKRSCRVGAGAGEAGRGYDVVRSSWELVKEFSRFSFCVSWFLVLHSLLATCLRGKKGKRRERERRGKKGCFSVTKRGGFHALWGLHCAFRLSTLFSTLLAMDIPCMPAMVPLFQGRCELEEACP